jgi:N-formylglutamate amidohydrolase
MPTYKDYVEYDKGTTPLIFSVPHGGMLECEDIPKRATGILGIDKGTIELARDLLDHFENIAEKRGTVGKKPSYIVSNVRRNKIDLNRPDEEAHEINSSIARQIYQFYHEKIRQFITENLQKFHYSLLIDVHGFESHKRPRGYRDVDMILGTDNLKTMFSKPVPKKNWNKNIRGKIINKFLELNIPIAPGRQRREEYVLTGGFTVLKYGASQIPHSQAIQIEFSDRIRYIDEDLKTRTVRSLAELLYDELVDRKTL